ncbi:MAG TPA: IPT/TIG domain-containing protein, partial [Acidobacteriaceae bacterium]|nr:IPT/TIG domain-containing protein [Acidobacteriaceae bacterium]
MRLANALGVLLLLSCCALAAAQTPTPVLTQAYDSARDGLNPNETTLTPANVSPATFGKVTSFAVDGLIYAQPLYVPGVAISGQGTHNVLYVATMHDSVYAFDADGLSLQPLWHASFINPAAGVTTEPVSDNGGNTDTDGEIGILSTPVIDSSTGTLYVVAKTDETSGGTTNQCFRLHALDITSGAERTGSPTACMSTSVTGTGSPNSGGHVLFSSLDTLQRPALALSGNNVYVATGSWGDNNVWHGWILSFNKSTLQLANTFNTTPNGTQGEGGIWMSGHGLAVDASGNLFFSTGNGAFDGVANYGDAFLRLTPTLGVTDYFSPWNQQALDSNDLDISSAGILLLPDSAGTTTHPHIMIGCGKDGTIYVVDRDNMGQFNSKGDTQIIQELTNVVGGVTINQSNLNYVENCYSGATYWNGRVYFGGISDSVKQFSFTNGLLSTSAVSQSPEVYQFPGANTVVSANGTTNGILWAIENAGSVDAGRAGTAVLHAYDATNLGTEFYSSNQTSTDNAGGAVKFNMPTVANGKVYVGTQTSVAVYGLFSSMPQAATPVMSPAGGSYSGSVSLTITDASPGTTIFYTTDGSTPTVNSSAYSGPITLTGSAIVNAIAVGGGYRYSADAVNTYTINGLSPISFAQVAAATPQTSVSTVSVGYPSPENVGDLNIVVVGWNDTTAGVQSVTDSSGNTYQLAIGATSGTALRQSIYYASGIKGGSDTVTVTFSQAAVNPDIRILEYRGVSTLDATAGASGSGTTASSGSATVHSPNELIFGANTVHTGNVSAGSGFTARIITTPDSDLAEDQVASAAGTYSATAPLTSSGGWVMQMASFSAAPPAAPTVTAVSPNSGSTSGGTAVTITGTNFATGATVTFGSAAATGVTVVNSTTITATTPAGTAGAVSVTVTQSGQSGSLANGFTYVVAPTVTGVSPSGGPTAGGTSVTITGTNFASGATATFGGAAATNVTVVNGTTITATTPAGSAGPV